MLRSPGKLRLGNTINDTNVRTARMLDLTSLTKKMINDLTFLLRMLAIIL
jgi:hypothetical protein